eukprot:8933194-Pyramimonas_sp.AAC.1
MPSASGELQSSNQSKRRSHRRMCLRFTQSAFLAAVWMHRVEYSSAVRRSNARTEQKGDSFRTKRGLQSRLFDGTPKLSFETQNFTRGRFCHSISKYDIAVIIDTLLLPGELVVVSTTPLLLETTFFMPRFPHDDICVTKAQSWRCVTDTKWSELILKATN